ncbi:hypothetical protein ACQPW3_08215 [Actinosynnema sp. CA-248983]
MAGRARQHQQSFFSHPLAHVRAERNWTYQDVVDVIARHVGNMAARREKAWRWEHRGMKPDIDSQYALAAELGVDRDVVRVKGWPDWLPTGDRLDLDLPWTMDAALSMLDRTAGVAVHDRRSFLTISASAVMTVAAQWLAVEPARLQAAVRGGRVEAALVDTFELRLPTLQQMLDALGGGSVRHLADAELRLVRDMLKHGSYSERLGQRLWNVAAELGRIAGWSSFDAGFHAAAERYFMAGIRAAHRARDRVTGANVMKCLSLQLMDADRPEEALSIAVAAREGAKQAPPRVVAMLTVREARTHAVLGNATECESLLSQAEKAMNRADDHESPVWAHYFDQAEYSAQVAACYLLLRRPDTTDRWLAQSLALQPDERPVDKATYLMWSAENAVTLGDVDRACSLITEAVPPSHRRSQHATGSACSTFKSDLALRRPTLRWQNWTSRFGL